MKDDTRTRPRALPWIAAILLLVTMSHAGLAGPVFKELLDGIGATDLPVMTRIIIGFHWAWVVPLAVIIGTVMLVGSRKWAARTTRCLSWIALSAAAAILITLALAAFTPIRMGDAITLDNPVVDKVTTGVEFPS